MTRPVSDIAFTPTVKAVQRRLGSRDSYARMEQRGGWASQITEDLATFVAQRDSLYLGTATADGQPYIQHRGGAKGFLKVLDDRTFAMSDFGGNKQYISIGNLAENDRACLFLMDYVNRRRIKVWGRARFVEGDAALLARVTDPDYEARAERVLVFDVAAWDVNCPKFIPRRLGEPEVEARERGLRERVRELEEENARLRAESTRSS